MKHNSKRVLLFAFTLLLAGVSFSQSNHSWDRYNFKFSSPVKLESFDSKSFCDYEAGNDNTNVYLKVYPQSAYEDYYYGLDGEAAMKVMLKTFSYTAQEGKGGPIPGIEGGYYQVADDVGEDGKNYGLVVLALAKSDKNQCFIEATINIYNKDIETAVKIAKSFKFSE